MEEEKKEISTVSSFIRVTLILSGFLGGFANIILPNTWSVIIILAILMYVTLQHLECMVWK
jgi:hypothetical protein